ncbi:hypothetical protein ACQ4LE_009406 [Meloidogyne hapla]
MPSIVWDYFDEFEGGGKCRLCGCIRNRKDKSTSTFWQHLERVHGLDKRLMLPNSPAINSLGDGGKKVKQTNNFNEINNYSNNITQKRHLEVNEIYSRDEQPVEKMPKLELMTELEKRATEETLKFISELVNQQKQTSPQPCSSTDWQNNNFNYSQNIKRNELIVKNECCPISSPIGINFNNFEYNQNPIIPLNKKIEPFEGSGLSLNDYMSGFLDSNHSLKNGSVNSETKTKCPLDENKKRSDYLNWEEFFMGTAILASLRSKDPCTQVGACIIKENKIVGTGYNGMPNGCNDDDMPWGKGNSDKFNTKWRNIFVCLPC